ncbi:MAG: hypothetical protein WC700_03520 [Gemmatimonadaceae bacterium]|jgi:hypothetical protein
MSTSRAPLRAAALGVLLASLLVSCGREAPAPTGDGVTLARHGMLAFEPVFPRLPGGASLTDVVEFEKVRVVLHRADGSVALDTIVFFPVGVDSVVLATSVPLSPSSGNSGENFKLDLGYMNAAGEVVFKGGPVDLTVVPKGSSNQPAPVQIPIHYSGPGSTATNVTISPSSVAVTEGQAFAFTAVATDASGAPLAGTPIVWASLDGARAVLNSSSGGAGHALFVRGDARIAAQLLTGPADTAVVSVSLVAKAIAMQSGDGQKGIIRTALAQPVVVKVTASDGIGVAGVNVAFAAATGGGSVGSAAVVTDAAGLASTTWTLGSSVGEQTLTATAAGLTGSPVTFKATARSVAPVRLAIATGPAATNGAGSPLPVTVHALDAQGDVAKTFTGTVALALTAGSPSAPLLGTLTATAVEGVATFTDVRINLVGTGYALAASASGLLGATTSSFAIVAGPAQRLTFAAYPNFGAAAGVLDVVEVIARDAAGNVATSFTGSVTISQPTGPVDVLTGTLTRSAVAGVASFEGLSLIVAGEYQLGAATSGLASIKGPLFTVRAGPPARLVLAGGNGQTADAGTKLPGAIIVSLVDRYGNASPASGVSITFATADGGSATPSSGVTDAAGYFYTSWTLGAESGTQTLTASSSYGSVSVTATALAPVVPPGGSGSSGDLVVIDDVNWADNGYGLSKYGETFNYPGNAQFVRNLLNFTPSGARATANKVLLLYDRGQSNYNFSSNWTNFAALLTSLGLTTSQTTLHSAAVPVPADVKLLIIHTPNTYFTITEINSLKSFAAQGGRILFIGENPAYYSNQALENTFIRAMGSPMTVVGDCAAPGEVLTSVSHALTSGVAATGSGGFYSNCASHHTLHGTGDVALMKDAANRIIVSVLKLNYTPLVPSLMAPIRALVEPVAPARAIRLPGSPDRTAVPRHVP